MENSAAKNYDRGKYFRKFQVWPLSNHLNYEGWLDNFSLDADRKIAERILDFFTYYSKDMVDKMLAVSVGRAGKILQEHYIGWTHNDFRKKCVYSFIPGENPNDSDSGHIFIRKIRDIARIPETQLISFHDLFTYLEQNSQTSIPIILVDDIIGSGAQCKTAWCDHVGGNNLNTLQNISQKYNHKFVYAPLIINETGRNRIQSRCPELF